MSQVGITHKTSRALQEGGMDLKHEPGNCEPKLHQWLWQRLEYRTAVKGHQRKISPRSTMRFVPAVGFSMGRAAEEKICSRMDSESSQTHLSSEGNPAANWDEKFQCKHC